MGEPTIRGLLRARVAHAARSLGYAMIDATEFLFELASVIDVEPPPEAPDPLDEEPEPTPKRGDTMPSPSGDDLSVTIGEESLSLLAEPAPRAPKPPQEPPLAGSVEAQMRGHLGYDLPERHLRRRIKRST